MMKLQLQALSDLIKRYGQIWSAAWHVRHQLDGEARLSHEAAFLPAHLELTETPVHPAPKWAMRLLIAFAAITLIWAIFGRLDVVVVAKGKLVPNVRVKVIQPMDTGMVKRILVVDGQHVKSGQPLVELDVTQARADASKATASLLDASTAAARAQALLHSQEAQTPIKVAVVAGMSPIQRQAAQRYAEGQYHEYQGKLAALSAELEKREAELATAHQVINKLTESLPLTRQLADSYKDLVKDNYVAKQDYLQKQQTLIEQEHDLATQKSHVLELQAGIQEQRREMEATTAAFRREQLDELNKAQQQLVLNQQDEAKAEQRERRMVLTAPIDGVVQQLMIHTAGGVVTTAQQLMTVVPDDTLEVEANVENKDIGFVNEGQMAAIKIDAFPYTRYGYLNGTVVQVSNDAAQDKKLGFVFPLHATLSTSKMQIENKWVNLTPGMAVTLEIKTGTRRVIEYFLTPLMEHVGESLRER